MRSEEDELFDLRKKLDLEEFAYTTKLIEIFGSLMRVMLVPVKPTLKGDTKVLICFIGHGLRISTL